MDADPPDIRAALDANAGKVREMIASVEHDHPAALWFEAFMLTEAKGDVAVALNSLARLYVAADNYAAELGVMYQAALGAAQDFHQAIAGARSELLGLAEGSHPATPIAGRLLAMAGLARAHVGDVQ